MFSRSQSPDSKLPAMLPRVALLILLGFVAVSQGEPIIGGVVRGVGRAVGGVVKGAGNIVGATAGAAVEVVGGAAEVLGVAGPGYDDYEDDYSSADAYKLNQAANNLRQAAAQRQQPVEINQAQGTYNKRY